jgi:DNA-binding NtrC family response regulator
MQEELSAVIRIGLYSEDRTLHRLLSSALGKEFQLQQDTSESAIRDLTVAGRCDVLILDFFSNRDDLADRIESWRRLLLLQVPALIMADESLHSKICDSIQDAAFGYCRRPPSIRDLKNLLRRASENSDLTQERQTAPQRRGEAAGCDRLIGSSAQMQRVYQLVRNVTNLNAAVLVTGESGTGKELIARAIHNLGPRSSHPFVAISCGAIPETLIESELFGHANGAFTGTVGPHEGYFEKSGDGTLFFDEIGELSLFTQVKLLRVLQELEFCRVGSTRVIPLRARLIFATNQDLPKLVAEGRFRHDLYYRINVMRIQAPPLQDHPEDIPLMAEHFLRRYSRVFGKSMDGIERKAVEMLMEHSWPGNVRELENVIQRAIIDAPGRSVRADDLNLTCDEDCPSEFNKILDIGDYLPTGNFEKQLREYKIKLALAAVRENNGNKALAARSLGMSRAYLYRLIGLAESETLVDQGMACSIKV